MSDAAVLRLDDDLRLHPDHVLAAFVLRQRERRLIDLQGFEPLPQLARGLVRVTGADATGITQLALIVHRHRERAHRMRIGGRRAIAGDDELLGVMTLALDEILRPARAIRRIFALRYDAFEIQAAGVLEDHRAVFRKMFGVADAAVFAGGLEQPLQLSLARRQRLAGQVTAVEMQKVEHVIDQAIAAAVLQIGLQEREARNAFVVFDDQFAVEQRGFGRQCGDRRRDRFEAVRPIQAFARQQAHLAAIEPRLDTIAVVFDLVQPFGAARRVAVQSGKARRNEVGQAVACGPCAPFLRTGSGRSFGARPRFCRGLAERHLLPRWRLGVAIAVPDSLLAFACSNFVDRAAGCDRQRLLVEDILAARAARRLVLALDQQPVVAALLRSRAQPHQMPAAVQFLAVEIEGQMPLGQPLVRIALGRPMTAIPDHHGTSAIFALRDGALEAVVLDRVVLDMDGKTLLAGIEARAARDRPAFHDAVELEPQIVMQPPRRMFLNHITVAAALFLAATRLRRDAELSLLAVDVEGHVQPARLRRLVLTAPRLRDAVLERAERDLPRCSALPPLRSERTERRSASIRLMTLLGRSGAAGAGLPACFALISAFSASS